MFNERIPDGFGVVKRQSSVGIGIPLLRALVCGIFRVSGDPGDAPVAVPGLVRLGIDVLVFGFAIWASWVTLGSTGAWSCAGMVLVHYAFFYDPIVWLWHR